MKITLLNDTNNWAGTESHILDLASALREIGADASIACPLGSPLATRAGAIPIVPLQIKGLLDRRAIRQLARLLRSGRADVLHAHNGRTQLHGALAVMLARRGTLVWTQHFIAPHHAQMQGRKAALMKRIHRAINARTRGFIAISGAVKAAMLERGEAPAEQITVVPNGIADPHMAKLEDAMTVRARYGIAPDALLVVALCRLEAEKEVEVLLHAWHKVAGKRPDARLIIGGRGAMMGELQRQIEALNIGKSAQLVGFVDDALSLINAADILAHPAPAEPFGLVFLEAMGLGKPIVACDGGAAPEIVNGPIESESARGGLNASWQIEDKRTETGHSAHERFGSGLTASEPTGILVAPGDADVMARALSELLNDMARAQTLGQAGRARFESHFTHELMAERTLAVYQKAVAKP